VGVSPARDRERSDAAVIADSLARPQAFATIFDRHFDAVHRYLARRAGSGRADDLAADTFTVAFERRRTFQASAGSARPWLFGIATNLLRNDWRAEQRAHAAVAQLSHRAAAGETGTRLYADPGDVGTELSATLAGLEPQHRDVLLLYAWEGMSYQEIAVALGVRVGTVRSRLSRARRRLREALAAEGTSDSSEVDA
jgi:RNA polymerase sigma factor (sigma-70 family)